MLISENNDLNLVFRPQRSRTIHAWVFHEGSRSFKLCCSVLRHAFFEGMNYLRCGYIWGLPFVIQEFTIFWQWLIFHVLKFSLRFALSCILRNIPVLICAPFFFSFPYFNYLPFSRNFRPLILAIYRITLEFRDFAKTYGGFAILNWGILNVNMPKLIWLDASIGFKVHHAI